MRPTRGTTERENDDQVRHNAYAQWDIFKALLTVISR